MNSSDRAAVLIVFFAVIGICLLVFTARGCMVETKRLKTNCIIKTIKGKKLKPEVIRSIKKACDIGGA